MEALTFSLTRLPRNSGAHTQQTHARTPYFWHHLRLWSAVVAAACLGVALNIADTFLHGWFGFTTGLQESQPNNQCNKYDIQLFIWRHQWKAHTHIFLSSCFLVYLTSSSPLSSNPSHPLEHFKRHIFTAIDYAYRCVFLTKSKPSTWRRRRSYRIKWMKLWRVAWRAQYSGCRSIGGWCRMFGGFCVYLNEVFLNQSG